MEKKSTVFTCIYDVVGRIPKGHVATYGQVAALAGNPRWSRVVGFALHVNPDPEKIPCFRVVNRFGDCSGAFAFGGRDAQRRLLQEDGVTFLPGGGVNLSRHLWRPGEECAAGSGFGRREKGCGGNVL